ncbi:MAG: S-layer homology domain-containing protein [Ruminococcaceae bacterium]|nr:S-layer homology domain-containing protein [Oscillospiraceae bacterium]
MKKFLCTALSAALLFSAALASDTHVVPYTNAGKEVDIVAVIGELTPEMQAAMEQHAAQTADNMSVFLPALNTTVGEAMQHVAQQINLLTPLMEDGMGPTAEKREKLRELSAYIDAINEVHPIQLSTVIEWQKKFDKYTYFLKISPTKTWETVKTDLFQFLSGYIQPAKMMTVVGSTAHTKTSLNEEDVSNLTEMISVARQTIHLEKDPSELRRFGYFTLHLRLELMTLENYDAVRDTLESFLTDTGISTSQIVAFSDMEGHWAHGDAVAMADSGYVKGTAAPVYGVTTYNPEGNVTLGEFLAIATRVLEKQDIGTSPSGHWALSYFNRAIELGLFTQSDFSATALDTPLSREDMAYLLVAVARSYGRPVQSDEGITIPDFGSVSQNRKQAVNSAYSTGLLNGDEQGNFLPHNNLTRAEVASVFYRIVNFSGRN